MKVINMYKIQFLIRMIKFRRKILYLQDLMRMIYIKMENMIEQIYFIIMKNKIRLKIS
jgi:hypothetical protein